MNERMRELELEAIAYADSKVPEDNRYNDIYHSIVRRLMAELVVRDCMTQIQSVREIKAGHAGPEYTQGFDDGMFVAISTIEEHFGIEE